MLYIFLIETVYHSSGVFSNLSSSWTSKPPLAVKYKFEPGSIDEPTGSKSLCSTLERLLAWEKKLYQEIKVLILLSTSHKTSLNLLCLLLLHIILLSLKFYKIVSILDKGDDYL